MTSGPGFQVAIGTGLSVLFAQLQQWLAPVPEPILGLALVALAGVFVWGTLRRREPQPTTPQIHEPAAGHCHGPAEHDTSQEATR